LPLLELANLVATPAISGANDSRVHQLQHRPLAVRMGDDLRAPALLEEIRGADHPPMTEREARRRQP